VTPDGRGSIPIRKESIRSGKTDAPRGAPPERHESTDQKGGSMPDADRQKFRDGLQSRLARGRR
jgi:hypothetical protein